MAQSAVKKSKRPPQPRSGRPPINYPDAAQYLGCTEAHIKRMVAEGRIEYIKLSSGRSGRVMFDPDDLDAFLVSRKVPAAS